MHPSTRRQQRSNSPETCRRQLAINEMGMGGGGGGSCPQRPRSSTRFDDIKKAAAAATTTRRPSLSMGGGGGVKHALGHGQHKFKCLAPPRYQPHGMAQAVRPPLLQFRLGMHSYVMQSRHNVAHRRDIGGGRKLSAGYSAAPATNRCKINRVDRQ